MFLCKGHIKERIEKRGIFPRVKFCTGRVSYNGATLGLQPPFKYYKMCIMKWLDQFYLTFYCQDGYNGKCFARKEI